MQISTRIKNDCYYTPIPIFNWLQSQLNLQQKEIFDPCCGQIRPTLEAFGGTNCILENDIDESVDCPQHFDASDYSEWDVFLWPDKIYIADWIVTNPPYSQPLLDKIVGNSLKYASEGVAMLLRLSYLEPCPNRRQILQGGLWHSKQLLAVYPVNPRPRFDPSKKGTDSSTVAWFIWGNESVKIPSFEFCCDWIKSA